MEEDLEVSDSDICEPSEPGSDSGEISKTPAYAIGHVSGTGSCTYKQRLDGAKNLERRGTRDSDNQSTSCSIPRFDYSGAEALALQGSHMDVEEEDTTDTGSVIHDRLWLAKRSVEVVTVGVFVLQPNHTATALLMLSASFLCGVWAVRRFFNLFLS